MVELVAPQQVFKLQGILAMQPSASFPTAIAPVQPLQVGSTQ